MQAQADLVAPPRAQNMNYFSRKLTTLLHSVLLNVKSLNVNQKLKSFYAKRDLVKRLDERRYRFIY